MNGRPLLILAFAALLACACRGDTTPVGAKGPVAPPDPDTGEFLPTVARVVEIAREAVLADPESARAWGELGMVLHSHVLMEPATTCYRQAQRLDGADFRWPYLAGVGGRGWITDDETLALLQRAHALNPVYAPLNIRLGELLLERRSVDLAKRHYELAAQAAPESSHALLGLGRVALAEGELGEAAELLEQARWQEWEHREVWIALVELYERTGQDVPARRAAERAATLRTNTPVPDPLLKELRRVSGQPDDLLYQAQRHRKRGEFDEAIARCRMVLEIWPDDVEARVDLAEALLLSWRDEEGIAELARALGVSPSEAERSKRVARWRDERLPADR